MKSCPLNPFFEFYLKEFFFVGTFQLENTKIYLLQETETRKANTW